jgi:plastocyanin
MQRFIPGFVFTSVLSLLMLASVACASTTPSDAAPASVAPDGTQHVTISASDDMKFQPAAVSVHTGQPLELTLRSAGQSAHDLTLSEGVAQPVKLTVNGGETTSRIFSLERPGTYKFECSMAGHTLAGMRGRITVQ